MDLDTAKRLRRRLQDELTAFTVPLSIGTALSAAPSWVDLEIARLGLFIDECSAIPNADGCVYKLPIENEHHILFISGLENPDLDSVVRLKDQLVFEHQGIGRCRPLPFISYYIKRVIERLEDEINKEKARIEYLTHRRNQAINENRPPTAPGVEWMPPPYSRFFIEHLNDCIKDAIHTVVKNNPQGPHRPEQIFDVLRQNHKIRIDQYVTSVVRKRFYEATFPYRY